MGELSKVESSLFLQVFVHILAAGARTAFA
jgi:hypothetical protein